MNYLELIEDYKEDIIESVQNSIRIKSVEEEALEGMPFGKGPYDALENILELGKNMGFKTKNMDGYVGYIEFGEGDETVGVLGHVDVVPEGEGWKFPPYEAIIDDGKIYGRGAIDDKGPTIATLYAMKALKNSNVKLNKKIRMIIGANEETDWRCMDYYFKHEEAPDMAFTPDADFPVIYAEKGIMVVELDCDIETKNDKLDLVALKGGVAPNVVPEKAIAIINGKNIDDIKDNVEKYINKKEYNVIVEKCDEGLKLNAKGISAHGSTPEKGESAIHHLLAVLGYLFDGDDDISTFIKLYNNRIGFLNHGEKIGCKLEDDVVGKLSFNPGVIEYENNKINLTIDIRYPVKYTYEDVFSGIKENLKDTFINVKVIDKELEPLYVEKDNELVQILMDVYKEETKDLDAKPLTIGGGTYARSMKNAVAFGPMFEGMEELAHQKNEYISIDHLMKITKIYANALYRLAK